MFTPEEGNQHKQLVLAGHVAFVRGCQWCDELIDGAIDILGVEFYPAPVMLELDPTHDVSLMLDTEWSPEALQGLFGGWHEMAASDPEITGDPDGLLDPPTASLEDIDAKLDALLVLTASAQSSSLNDLVAAMPGPADVSEYVPLKSPAFPPPYFKPAPCEGCGDKEAQMRQQVDQLRRELQETRSMLVGLMADVEALKIAVPRPLSKSLSDYERPGLIQHAHREA